MSGSFSSGGYGRESSAYGGSERYGGGSQNRAGGGKQGGNGQGGRGGSAGVSTAEYIAGKMSGWKKDPTTGNWSNPEFNRQAGIDQGGRGGGTFGGQTPDAPTRDQFQQQDQIGANVSAALNDYNDVGNSTADDLGNLFARALGFTEMDPTVPGFSQPGMPGQTGRANWQGDPAVALGSLGGILAGVPFGGGFIADQISSALGRPLSVNLGPSVVGEDTIDPETGVVIASSKTHTGPSMTVRDNNDPNVFYGVPRGLAYLAGGASKAAPTKQTFVGTDPTIEEPAPVSPYVPVTPQPTPIDTAPNGINVSPGNTGLSDQQLTDLFLQHMGMGRTSRGRNPASVIV